MNINELEELAKAQPKGRVKSDYLAAANPSAILELIAAYREAVAALWICAKHNELFHGKDHNTVIGSLHALATAKRLGVE